MTEIERELTYLAKKLPDGLADMPSKLIVDVYYPLEAAHSFLRVRQNGDKYEITKKEPIEGNDSSQQNEHTIKLTREEFLAITKNPGKRVAKRRFAYSYNGMPAEVDVFQDDLAGLVVVDFEFADRASQEAFTMPDFCLADVTQDEAIAGGVLAGKSFADVAPLLEKYNYKPLTLEAA